MRTTLRKTQVDTASRFDAIPPEVEPSHDPSWDLSRGLRYVLSHWHFVMLFTLAITVSAGLFNALSPNVYTATATLLPVSSDQRVSMLASLSPGLAGALGGQTAPSDQELYPTLLRARTVIEPILNTQIPNEPHGKGTSTLLGLVGTPDLERACDRVRTFLATSVDRSTGVCHVAVTMTDPTAAASVCNAWVQSLAQRGVDLRVADATQQRQFIAGRIGEIKKELGVAEETLRVFRGRNLNYATSTDPNLRLEHERLQRDVTLKTSLYMRLNEEYELSRLEEQRDVSRIRILDSAYVPTQNSGPRRVRSTMMAGLAAFPLSASLVIAWHFLIATLGYDPLDRFQQRRAVSKSLWQLLHGGRRDESVQ